jgi:2-dehydro-3-deoxygluconokinase
MLRLDPGDGRVRTARSFTAWEGGGEYNVARGLRKAASAAHRRGHRLRRQRGRPPVEDFICRAASIPASSSGSPTTGIGRTVRNGLNFTERGFGVRGAVGVPDRGNTAASAR